MPRALGWSTPLCTCKGKAGVEDGAEGSHIDRSESHEGNIILAECNDALLMKVRRTANKPAMYRRDFLIERWTVQRVWQVSSGCESIYLYSSPRTNGFMMALSHWCRGVAVVDQSAHQHPQIMQANSCPWVPLLLPQQLAQHRPLTLSLMCVSTT
jgi:hypothetical protein